MEQKWADFALSCGKVSSWNSLDLYGSNDRLNWSNQRNSNLAFESSLSLSTAKSCPFDISDACAAILYATSPSLTSSLFGSPKCSLGVT